MREDRNPVPVETQLVLVTPVIGDPSEFLPVLSAALAGLAGGTKAIVFQLASLTDVAWQMSGEVVLITLLGGLGTIFGPIAGAFVVIALETYLAQLGSWVTVIQGAIFILCVMAFRRGIVGELARLLKRPL